MVRGGRGNSNFFRSSNDYLWLNNRFSGRLEGGGCCKEKTINPDCNPKPVKNDCKKTIRLDPDNMIQAFQEAQDFVDGFGKVPGLAGLGLADYPINAENHMNSAFACEPVVDNISETPCGEPKCKSRPKKAKVVSLEKTNNPTDSAAKTEPQHSKSHQKTKSGKHRSHSTHSRVSKPIKFDYDYGDDYPASVYGHKNCGGVRPLVPSNMGWMWNQPDCAGLKPPLGWKPGAISMGIREILKEAREGLLETATRPRSAPGKSKKSTAKNVQQMGFNQASKDESEDEKNFKFPPTLHVHRKEGDYYVTLYPVQPIDSKTPKLDVPANPYHMKVVRSKTSMDSSSERSDMEIEFSPPAAINRRKKQPDVVHTGTVVTQDEIINELTRNRNDNTKKKGK